MWCVCLIMEAEAHTYLISRKCLPPSPPLSQTPLASPFFFLPSSLQLKVSRWLEERGGVYAIFSKTGKKKKEEEKKERARGGGRLSWRAVCDFREHFLRGEKVGLLPPETQLSYFLPLLLHPNLPSLKLLGGFSNFWQFDALCESHQNFFHRRVRLLCRHLEHTFVCKESEYVLSLTGPFLHTHSSCLMKYLLSSAKTSYCVVQGSLVCESCISGTMWCNLHVFCMWIVHCKGCVCLSECVFVCIFKAAHVIVLACVWSLNVA